MKQILLLIIALNCSIILPLAENLATLEYALISLKQATTTKKSELHLRDKFFKDTMGVSEEDFLDYYDTDPELIKKFIEHDASNDLFFIHGTERYQAGKFDSFSLAKLNGLLNDKPKPGGGKLSIIEAQNTPGKSYEQYVDVGSLQAQPENRDAVFQVASNFSALEPTHKGHAPEDGISAYTRDKTQGPFASISAAPGLIYRMYYIFYSAKTEPKEWRQTTERQINLLDSTQFTPEKRYMLNGYITLPQDDANELKKLAEQLEKDYKNIKVGVHRDIQVAFGRVKGNYHETVTDPHQIIHQVFTAAVDFGGTNAALRENSDAQKIGQLILNAAYEGTIKSAAAHNKKKVYLTLIGGGVFANELSRIGKAIKRQVGTIRDFGLDVTVIIWDSTKSSTTQMDELKEILKELVQQTGGTHIVYSPDFPQGKPQ